MEKLFDIDELHASYRKKKLRNWLIAIPIVLLVLVILAGFASYGHNSNANVNLTGSTTRISGDIGSAQQNNLVTTQQPDSVAGSVSQPKPSNGDYIPSSTFTYTPTPPPATSSAPKVSNVVAPDPTKCSGIRTEMANATASLESQAAQLRQQTQTEQSYITNNSTYNWQNGYGQAPPTDTSVQQAQLQRDQQQLNSVVSQINAINNSYIPQLTGNMC